jgi:hypothetical protein
MQQDAPEVSLEEQVSEVEVPQHRIGGKKEIQAHEHAAGTEDAADLGDGFGEAGEVAQAVADEHGVEGGIAEGQAHGVCAGDAVNAVLAGAEDHAVR